MGKNKVLVKVHPEGRYVVDLDKSIDMAKVTVGARVALRNDSYTLHLLLPTKVDPLVSLMKVEKVPDSTYDMVGGLDQQIKEIKEVWWPIPFNLSSLAAALKYKSCCDQTYQGHWEYEFRHRSETGCAQSADQPDLISLTCCLICRS